MRRILVNIEERIRLGKLENTFTEGKSCDYHDGQDRNLEYGPENKNQIENQDYLIYHGHIYMIISKLCEYLKVHILVGFYKNTAFH